MTIAAAAGASVLLSKALRREADRLQAGQESSWLASFDEESYMRPARPMLSYGMEAALLALHRPAAM